MYLLRHGQSLFNLHFTETRRDPGIEDPGLTPLGREQAQAAARHLAGIPIRRIIVSPYTRALQTAEAILAVHDVPVRVMAEVRERYVFTCDIGRHKDDLTRDFARHEFGHLPDRWWPKAAESAEATVQRANAFREMMRGDDEAPATLLVSHWAFILALTGVSAANGEVLDYDPHTPAPAEIRWQP